MKTSVCGAAAVAIGLLFSGACAAGDGGASAAATARDKVLPAAAASVPQSTQAGGGIVAGARMVPGARTAIDVAAAANATGKAAAPAGDKAAPSAASPAKSAEIYLKTLPDGSVELSNLGESDGYDRLSIDVPSAAAADTAIRTASGTDSSRSGEMPVDTTAKPNAGEGGAETGSADVGGESANWRQVVSGAVAADVPSNNIVVPTGYKRPKDPSLPPVQPDPTPIPKPKITCNRMSGLVQASPVYSGSTCQPADPFIAAGAAKGRLALLAGGNAALSRRYLMMDKTTYQQVVLGGASPQAACSPGATSGTSTAPSQTETQVFDGDQCPAGWVPAG